MFSSDRYKLAVLVLLCGTTVALVTGKGDFFLWACAGTLLGLALTR